MKILKFFACVWSSCEFLFIGSHYYQSTNILNHTFQPAVHLKMSTYPLNFQRQELFLLRTNPTNRRKTTKQVPTFKFRQQQQQTASGGDIVCAQRKRIFLHRFIEWRKKLCGHRWVIHSSVFLRGVYIALRCSKSGFNAWCGCKWMVVMGCNWMGLCNWDVVCEVVS